MYEKENIAVNVVSAPGHDGFYHSLSVSGGDVYDDVSDGNNGETEQFPVDTVSSGTGLVFLILVLCRLVMEILWYLPRLITRIALWRLMKNLPH